MRVIITCRYFEIVDSESFREKFGHNSTSENFDDEKFFFSDSFVKIKLKLSLLRWREHIEPHRIRLNMRQWSTQGRAVVSTAQFPWIFFLMLFIVLLLIYWFDRSSYKPHAMLVNFLLFISVLIIASDWNSDISLYCAFLAICTSRNVLTNARSAY